MERNQLNDSDVSGNTIAWMAEKDMDKDLYHCQECDGYVPEDEWNDKRNCCYSCWWKI